MSGTSRVTHLTVESRTINGRAYSYLYLQERRGDKREHIYLRAKNLLDFRNRVLYEQAEQDVFKKQGRILAKSLPPPVNSGRTSYLTYYSGPYLQ